MSAPVLRFARVIANSVHENAPDHSTHTIEVGELREAVEEMKALYEALVVARKWMMHPDANFARSTVDRAIVRARGEEVPND